MGLSRVLVAAYSLAFVPLLFLGLSLPDADWGDGERFHFFNSSLLLAIAAAFVASLTIRSRTRRLSPVFVGFFCAGFLLSILQALGSLGYLLGTLILFAPFLALIVVPPIVVHVFIVRDAWRCSTVTESLVEFSRFVFGLVVPLVLLWLFSST